MDENSGAPLGAFREYLKGSHGDHTIILARGEEGRKIASRILLGLPAVVLRVRGSEMKRHPFGVMARLLSFLVSDLYGVILLDDEALEYLTENEDRSALIHVIYDHARWHHKIVIVMTDRIPLPSEIIEKRTTWYLCGAERLGRLVAVYPEVKERIVRVEEDHWESLPERLIRLLRSERG